MKIARLIIPVLLAVLATSVQAETINCTPITSLPATIDTQGLYCLTGNLATDISSGNAIEITANNVALDLNGWKVGGQAAGTGTNAYGIYSTAVNVTVKNGIVRGFNCGIYLTGRGAVVQGITADQNTTVGIKVSGPGSLIQGNQVVDTGGSTSAAIVSVIGIFASGSGTTVSNNMVSGLTATGSGTETGILHSGATVRDNMVSDTAVRLGGLASYGIQILGGGSSIAVNNAVANFVYGIASNSGSIYAHNTVVNCNTAYSGGTAGAGNSP